MIDLVLYAANKAALATFAKTHPVGNPLMDDEGNTREGVSYCWWAGNGKLMTKKGTYDGQTQLTAPTFLSGVVAIMRIHSQRFFDNKLIPDEADPDKDEQHAKSKIVRYIKNNGTQGTMGGITYFELDGVRIFRPVDVEAFLASKDLPGHTWVGGNQYG
jgi:hypothetical protein